MNTPTSHWKLSGRSAAVLAAVILAVMISVVSVQAASSVVQDKKGDALSATESANNVDPGTPEDTARGYLDIKSVKVTKQNGGDRYVFSMTLAEPVPQDFSNEVCYTRIGPAGDTTTVLVNPPDPNACFFAWNWDLFDDPDLFSGSPISPTVRWINGAFQGIAFTAGAPVLFDTFSVSGAHISATLDASEIESRVDTTDGFYFAGVSRNHRIDFGGDPLVGVADIAGPGSWAD